MAVDPMERDDLLRKVEDIAGRILGRTEWNVQDISWELYQSGLLHPSVDSEKTFLPY